MEDNRRYFVVTEKEGARCSFESSGSKAASGGAENSQLCRKQWKQLES